MKLSVSLLALGLTAVSAHPEEDHTIDIDDVCGFLTDKSTCRSYGPGECTWLAGSDTCVAAIPDDVNDEDYNAADYCGQFDGTKPKCNNEDRCGYVASDGVCLPIDDITCGHFDGAKRDCKNTAGCAYVGDVCVNEDDVTCGMYETGKTCKADDSCMMVAGVCVDKDDVTCGMMDGYMSQCNANDSCIYVGDVCISPDDVTCRMYDGSKVKCRNDESCTPLGEFCCDTDDISGSCPELDDATCSDVDTDRVCSEYADAGLCTYQTSRQWQCLESDGSGGDEGHTIVQTDPCAGVDCGANGMCNSDGSCTSFGHYPEEGLVPFSTAESICSSKGGSIPSIQTRAQLRAIDEMLAVTLRKDHAYRAWVDCRTSSEGACTWTDGSLWDAAGNDASMWYYLGMDGCGAYSMDNQLNALTTGLTSLPCESYWSYVICKFD